MLRLIPRSLNEPQAIPHLMPLLVRRFTLVERLTSGVEPEQSPDEFHGNLADLRSAFYGFVRSIDEHLSSIEGAEGGGRECGGVSRDSVARDAKRLESSTASYAHAGQTAPSGVPIGTPKRTPFWEACFFGPHSRMVGNDFQGDGADDCCHLPMSDVGRQAP